MSIYKLKTALYATSVAALSIGLAITALAQSRQNQQGSSAAKSDAEKKWAEVGPQIRQCVNTMFSTKNINVDQISDSGMSPTDKNIAPVIELCQTVTTAQLKANYPCKVTNSKGEQVSTTCSQSYAKAVNGKWVPISRDDFLRAVSKGEQVNIGDFEAKALQNAALSEGVESSSVLSRQQDSANLDRSENTSISAYSERLQNPQRLVYFRQFLSQGKLWPRKNFSCRIEDYETKLMVSTLCDDFFFVRSPGGPNLPVSREEFIQAVEDGKLVSFRILENYEAGKVRKGKEREKQAEERRQRHAKFLETPLGKDIEKYLASPASEYLSPYARAKIWSIPAEQQANFRRDWEGVGLADFYRSKAIKSCDDHFNRLYVKRVNGKDVKTRFVDHFRSGNPLDSNNKPIGNTWIAYRIFTVNPYGGYGEDLGFFTCNVSHLDDRVTSVKAGMAAGNQTVYR